jgi:hypothetical protein
MKTFSYFLATATLLSFSCQKELSELDQPADNAVQFKKMLANDKTYRVAAFYSEVPIDYNPYDTITTLETDLWHHVLFYLKDDENVFRENGTLEVIQHEIKMPGDTSPVLIRQYSTENVESVVMFNYLDHQYNPLPYFLHEKGSDYFIIYTLQGDLKLFSKFVQVK